MSIQKVCFEKMARREWWTFRLSGISKVDGMVLLESEESDKGEEIATLFADSEEVKFFIVDTGGEPIVEASMLDVEPVILACTNAHIYGTQEQINEIKQKLIELEAFKR